jgi:hypothetical protein
MAVNFLPSSHSSAPSSGDSLTKCKRAAGALASRLLADCRKARSVSIHEPIRCYGRRLTEAPSVQYRIQFLDRSGNVIREWSANAHTVAGAVALIVDADWPPRAVAMRVLDAYGREVHSAIRADGIAER